MLKGGFLNRILGDAAATCYAGIRQLEEPNSGMKTDKSHQSIVVYCDESRHDSAPGNQFMGIGGIWIPFSERDKYRRGLKRLAADHHLRSEIKWNKTSDVVLEGYKALVDAFFSASFVRFRAILVDHAILDYNKFHGGDTELGFYKFYYLMLKKWLEPDTEYTILLDHKINTRPDRYSQLEGVLVRSTDSTTDIKLSVADSRESHIAQLTDLLLGAVTSAWCKTEERSPKHMLQQYISDHLGRPSLRFASPSPQVEKFNVFKIHLSNSSE